MTLGRSRLGINKVEDAVVNYLPFRGWIRQGTLCDRMSVTFLSEAMGNDPEKRPLSGTFCSRP